MLSFKQLPRYVPQLGQILLLLAAFLQVVSAVSITDVFDIERGNPAGIPGGCGIVGGDTDKLLTKWFADCQKLASLARTSVALTDTLSKEHLTAYFNYKPETDPKDARDLITQVDNFFNKGALESGKKVKLFCNSDWLVQQEWTDKYVNENGKRTERTIGEQFGISKKRPPRKRPFFWPAANGYGQADPGDFCKQKGRGKNLGSTDEGFKVKVVTLCINNFSPKEKTTLSELDPVDKEGISLSDRRTHSLTMYHEIFHVIGGNKNTPDASYRLDYCMALKAPDKRSNPESYVFYSLALYLRETTNYTFATTAAKSVKKPETTTTTTTTTTSTTSSSTTTPAPTPIK